ncbi:MAG: hypothetical protein K1X39_00095 [Thermoflexales bacterium]|nr:hypothetical protein [Thermoflexales bacterium]
MRRATALLLPALAFAAALIVAALAQRTPAPADGLAPRDTNAPLACSPSFTVAITFTNGANWTFCWEMRTKEGVVYRDGRYAPPGGAPIHIFAQLGLAQIFVPYDTGSPRLHDISDFGMGPTSVVLDAADCPGGSLLSDGLKLVVCQQVVGHGLRQINNSDSSQKEALVMWSSSQIGAYNYIPQWMFHDDGTIEPTIGASGKLQYVDTNSNFAAFGWPLGGGRFGRSHVHTIYYRLDFDIGPAGNDVVEQYEFGGSGGFLRRIFSTTLTTETAAQFSAERFRFWRVVDPTATNADGHPISYEISPRVGYAHRVIAEPWTQNDVYVTEYAVDEICATHNGSNCGGSGSDVSGFVNGQTVHDPVVWVGVTFHHVPRDEDEVVMPMHWESFRLYPRDLTAVNPMP